MISFRLDGKRALVTGASKGIGLGIAQGLADAGASVVLVARGQEGLDVAAGELRSRGAKVETAAFDLAKLDEIESFYQNLVVRHGGFDILINNAGMNRRGPAHELSMADYQAVIDLNLGSVYAMSCAFARERIAAKQPGRIVSIASLTSSATRPTIAPYSASKGGVLMLTRALALDWASHGILVNAIGPGYIDTPLNEPLKNNPQFDCYVKERCPLGRWGTPEDLAGAAVFLSSDAASFITGQILYVDGGWLARF